MLAPPSPMSVSDDRYYAATPPLTLTPQPSPGMSSEARTPEVHLRCLTPDYFGFKPWTGSSASPSAATTPTSSSPVLGPICTCRPSHPTSPLPSPDLESLVSHPPSLRLRPKLPRLPCEVHQHSNHHAPRPPVELTLRPPHMTGLGLRHARAAAKGIDQLKDLPFPPRGSSRAALWDLTMSGSDTGSDPTTPTTAGPFIIDPPTPSPTSTAVSSDAQTEREQGRGRCLDGLLDEYLTGPEVSRWSTDSLADSSMASHYHDDEEDEDVDATITDVGPAEVEDELDEDDAQTARIQKATAVMVL